MGDKATVKVDVDTKVKRDFESACRARGMNQTVGLTRLLRWFNGQTEEIQAAVLGAIPDSLVESVVEELLHRLAEEALRGSNDSGDLTRKPTARTLAAKRPKRKSE